ncbi:MAG: hypothetical protein N3A63_09860 [Bacteroidetes bacterium]|nr:hypothetical protein [Bacteroidota bacterium]
MSVQKYSRVFWIANIVELFEGAAYYGMFIVSTLYLTNVVGFTNIWAAWISGGVSAGMYLLSHFPEFLQIQLDFEKRL